MQNVQDIISKKVSFQSAAWSSITKDMSVGDVLQEIRSTKYFQRIENLRAYLATENVEAYNIHKKTLPAVTFCASFNENRKRENLNEYNYLVVIDIDKLDDEELQRVKEVLSLDDCVFSYWDSPSKKGVKGLVSIEYEYFDNKLIDNMHKSAFIKLASYFDEKYNIILDESGSDTTRLCFVSYDPNLVLKQEFQNFKILESDLYEDKSLRKKASSSEKSIVFKGNRDKLFNSSNRNKPSDRKVMQAIIKYLTKREMSITSSYEEWYKVAYAISNTFTFEIGEKYFLSLCRLDKEKYDEASSKNILNYCYMNTKGDVKFNTVLYYANLKGYYTNLQKSEVLKTD